MWVTGRTICAIGSVGGVSILFQCLTHQGRWTSPPISGCPTHELDALMRHFGAETAPPILARRVTWSRILRMPAHTGRKAERKGRLATH